MIELMQQLFGTYAPIDGQPDYQYIGAVLIFSIVLWSVFKILGAVIKK